MLWLAGGAVWLMKMIPLVLVVPRSDEITAIHEDAKKRVLELKGAQGADGPPFDYCREAALPLLTVLKLPKTMLQRELFQVTFKRSKDSGSKNSLFHAGFRMKPPLDPSIVRAVVDLPSSPDPVSQLLLVVPLLLLYEGSVGVAKWVEKKISMPGQVTSVTEV